MAEPKFKPDDDGFYRIKESQKNDLKEFLKKQMESEQNYNSIQGAPLPFV